MPKKSILKDKNALEKAIQSSSSSSEVLEKLGLRAAGGNFAALRKASIAFELDLPKFKRNISGLEAQHARRFSDEVIFVENSTYSDRSNIKKRMYAMGIPEECNKCGIGNSWQGEPLSLTLEHINGIWNDNRLENLEILCPNCHSQTSTFAGKGGHARPGSSRKPRVYEMVTKKGQEVQVVVVNRCTNCSTPINRKAKRCQSCDNTKRYNKSYPDIETLVEMVSDVGFVKASAMVGVADTALRKHMRKLLPAEHPVFVLRARKRVTAF